MGISRGLPDQAYDLILSHSSSELITKKIFFLPYQSHLHVGKLEDDLMFSKEFGLVPLYFDALPSSKSIEVVAFLEINLPSLSLSETESHRKLLRKVKHTVSQLLTTTRETALSSLNDLKYVTEELSDSCSKSQSIHVYVLGFLGKFDNELQVALVV